MYKNSEINKKHQQEHDTIQSSSSTRNLGKTKPPKKKNSNLTYAIAGFTSGCTTRFFCQPLDVVKIRFQLQVEPISRSSSVSKYRSLTQTLVCIIQEESIFALWKGHIPAQILSGIYGIFDFKLLNFYIFYFNRNGIFFFI